MERNTKAYHQQRPPNYFSSTFIILLLNVFASTYSINSYEAPLSPGVPAPPLPPGVPPDETNDNTNSIVALRPSLPLDSPSFMEIPPSSLQFLPMPPPPPPPHFERALNWPFNFFMNAPTGPMMPPMLFPMFSGSHRPINAAILDNPDLSGQNGFIPSSDRIVWPDDNNI